MGRAVRTQAGGPPISKDPRDDVPERVRSACAWVAGHARDVVIAESLIEPYADALALEHDSGLDLAIQFEFGDGDLESLAAFVLCLDAINFGSGWWPTIRKRPGCSGYETIATGLTERFLAGGAWTCEQLTSLPTTALARTLGQPREHPLIGQFTDCLRDVGAHVQDDHGGRFIGVVEAAGGSAVELANLLSRWTAFADVSLYDGREVPFYKRAQIAAADINRAGVAKLCDDDRLTAFADNLVPHVLRIDGIIRLDPALARAIDSGELLVHGSPAEVELRASAVHAIELLASACDHRLSPAQIDAILWNRGRGERYKATPRPRSRSTAY
jgi:Potential Queuosine, Q, salvage protein family